MAAKPILITGTLPVGAGRPQPLPAFSWLAAISDYWALTKPEVNFLIAIARSLASIWPFQANLYRFPWLRLVHTLLGTLLVVSGAGTLNQYIERRFDALMRRTSRRPLAAGRLKPSGVLWFGIALSSVGSIYLAIAVNALASLLAIVTLVSYLLLYTPAQTKNTAMYSGRSLSRCNAAADRLGSSIGQVEFGSMGHLRPTLSMAVPSFHGNHLDVPRRLRSCGLLRAASGQSER
ncbi:MAG: UbiA family prenyltransferase [Candidatus Sulfotelmatobacter sp.]